MNLLRSSNKKMRENCVKITLLRNVNKEIYVLPDEATKIAGETNSDQEIIMFSWQCYRTQWNNVN